MDKLIENLKKILKTPIGAFGAFLIIFGGIWFPFAGQGVPIPMWMLISGVLFITIAPRLMSIQYSIFWQIGFMLLCPLAMLGYFGMNEYVYEDEFICLIPEGYKGRVTIKYGQPDGQKVEMEDGKYLFRVGKEDTLKVQHRHRYIIDLLNSAYYSVSPNGERKLLQRNQDSTQLQVFNIQFYHKDKVPYQTFLVGIPAMLKKIKNNK